MFPSAACEHLPFAAPSKTFFDLTVLYMLDLDVTAFGGGTCVVSSAMMSELGITAAELDSAVRRNISDCDFKLQKPKPKTIQQNPILANSYIVSCEKHRNAVLLFPEYFQKLANYLQDDLYVLQLSIYHVLVVPAATFTACSVDEIAPILYSALRKFAPKATVLGTSILYSECKNRLCGMTTAPSTLMITGIACDGNTGFTHPVAAAPQSIFTIQISTKKQKPIRETKSMISFSILLYALVNSQNKTTTRISMLPTLIGMWNSICSAMAPPK